MKQHVSGHSNFDVIVIGAGVNGIGIARDAAIRGLRVLLVEQSDLCSGVSAWSGRLIHGGLRYLEQYDFRLVRESLLEREDLFRTAAHLVKPVPLMMPLYREGDRPWWLIELGMITYDILSWRKTPPFHRFLGRKKTLERFPGIDSEGLRGSVVFYDGQVEYAERLCVELAIDAQRNGASILTHTSVSGIIVGDDGVEGVETVNHLSGRSEFFRGSVVLNAAGPWIDRIFDHDGIESQPRLNGGTKGSHLVVGPFAGAPSDVVYYESPIDSRLVLIIPWMGRYLIGTTDIRFEGDPDDARCDIGEVDYLLDAVNRLIPSARLTFSDVLFTYSGIRPLPFVPDKAESSIQRSHSLFDHSASGLPGVVTVVGGKLTTFRQLAEDAVDDAQRRLGHRVTTSSTRGRLLPGYMYDDKSVKSSLVSAGAANLTAQRLVDLYGSRAVDVWELAIHNSELRECVHPATGAIMAEAHFAVDNEFALTLTDVLARRMLLAFEPDHGVDAIEPVLVALARHMGWGEDRVNSERVEYLAWLDHLALPNPTGPRSVSFGAGVPK